MRHEKGRKIGNDVRKMQTTLAKIFDIYLPLLAFGRIVRESRGQRFRQC